ncbi:dihydroxyacetone kinase subunit DhaL [Nocardiopsis trehalosi]|uniref:dihydroxyacetone kinase subunit DhaL n=1 Tax=Nocardiopsis trehalosi TaxID=109329 RepID=UPI000836E387|nr:dihydroxyacetone kinase subunit DhaL [Nocardiopsis trehalosi]
MDADLARSWLAAMAAAVTAERDRLTELDSAIGDGDHGANLDRGFTAVRDALADDGSTTPGEVLVRAGAALISKVGGASGPLYGTALRAAGRDLAGAAPGPTEVADALTAGLDGVRALGGAAPGDKTMVDAFAPAVEALCAGAAEGADLAAAARAAADAAAEGARATVPMRARKGRASYLGDRSTGHEDPGAASTALLFRALADAADRAGEAP